MKEPNTQERRKLRRQNLAYYMQVINGISMEKMGHLVDLSISGLMIDTLQALPIGRDYRLRVETTPEVADKASIEFTARTRWCKNDRMEPYLYNVGFEIISITAHDTDIIQRIMDKYGARSNTSLGRF